MLVGSTAEMATRDMRHVDCVRDSSESQFSLSKEIEIDFERLFD